MKQKHYYIIEFSDLTDKKQNEIVGHLTKRLLTDEEVIKYLEGRAETPEKAREIVEKAVERACSGTTYEWEILVAL